MPTLTRPAASAAVEHFGWRLLLGFLCAAVPVESLAEAQAVAGIAIAAAGDDAGEHLRVDLRLDRVEFAVQTRETGWLSDRDLAIVGSITAALDGRTVPVADPRAVQMLEIAIDAIDIRAVAPFWAAVMAYVAERDDDGNIAAVIDPLGQGPAIWFQQMDVPRPQRNRIHLDITVPHDQADARVAAALAAGGHLVSDASARSFWVVADAEGNEACVCTWQDREHG
jgi:4a-hydroxytetrahydrobiopterin dehydratase